MEMTHRGFLVDFFISASGVSEELRVMEQEHARFTLHPISVGTDLIAAFDWKRVASSTGRLGGSKLALMETFVEAVQDMSGPVEHWRAMMEGLSGLQPDVVVLDHAHKILQQWAEGQRIPTVVMHTPYFLTGTPTGCAEICSDDARRLDEFLEHNDPFAKLDKAMEELGIEGSKIELGEGEQGARAAHSLAPHTFVFCEPELLNTAQLPSRVHAVGPCFSEREPVDVDVGLLPWFDAAVAAHEKVLYVAFGTLANGFLNKAAVGWLLNAFAGLGNGWRVLWSLPEEQQQLVGQAPPWLRLESFVRQRAVLMHPAVQLFLTHGGQTSVNEGISAGCPLVCMPLFCDQYEMAESVLRHGLGLVFHKDELLAGKARRLSLLLVRVAEEASFYRAAQRHAHLMRIRGGSARAATVIESIAYCGADFGEMWQELPEHRQVAEEMTPEVVKHVAPTLLQQASQRISQDADKKPVRLRAADGKAAGGEAVQ